MGLYDMHKSDDIAEHVGVSVRFFFRLKFETGCRVGAGPMDGLCRLTRL